MNELLCGASDLDYISQDNINIFKTDETGINLFEYENNEDIGDFEFPDEEAYLNIVNFIKTRKEDAALGSN